MQINRTTIKWLAFAFVMSVFVVQEKFQTSNLASNLNLASGWTLDIEDNLVDPPEPDQAILLTVPQVGATAPQQVTDSVTYQLLSRQYRTTQPRAPPANTANQI